MSREAENKLFSDDTNALSFFPHREGWARGRSHYQEVMFDLGNPRHSAQNNVVGQIWCMEAVMSR
jgi:hypothetical protein